MPGYEGRQGQCGVIVPDIRWPASVTPPHCLCLIHNSTPHSNDRLIHLRSLIHLDHLIKWVQLGMLNMRLLNDYVRSCFYLIVLKGWTVLFIIVYFTWYKRIAIHNRKHSVCFGVFASHIHSSRETNEI